MMRDLAQRPAAVAVGSVELRIGKAAQCGAQAGGSLFNVSQALLLLFRGGRACVGKLSNWIAWVRHKLLVC